ncbi:MAG TPA: response regulator transcription factor [Polyangiaceae bacterium]
MTGKTAESAPRGTVLLVEDETDTLELLGKAIERAGYACLKAADAQAALAHARGPQTIDVVVTDIVLGPDDRGGLRLIDALRAAGIDAKVIVITAYADFEKVKSALNSGASHLLEKPFRAAELLDVVARVRTPTGDVKHSIERLFTRAALTDKERTVARQLLEGLSSTEIADALGNSPKTIRQHVSQIYAKCEVGSRAELFRLLYRG